MEVSVVIPVYNREKYIVQCIQSALDQQEVREVIVIDDGSSDQSASIISRMAISDPRIKMIHHPGKERKGISASRNLGILKATSEYLAFLDSDDFYLPKRFELDRNLFDKHPDADGIYGTVENFADPGGVAESIREKVNQDFPDLNILSIPPESLLKTLMLRKRSYIHLNGLVIKHSITAGAILFDTNLEQAEDTDFIIRLAASKKLYSNESPRIVAKRRYHSQNIISDKQHAVANRHKMYKKWIKNQFYHADCYWCRLKISYQYVKLYAKINLGLKRLNLIRLFCVFYFPVFLVKEHKSFL
jgi:glycosyltransferase involved in cell wall biosynthesis